MTDILADLNDVIEEAEADRADDVAQAWEAGERPDLWDGPEATVSLAMLKRARDEIERSQDGPPRQALNRLKPSPGGSRESIMSAARFLRARYEKARCDSDGVSNCVRCNTMYLVNLVESLTAEPK